MNNIHPCAIVATRLMMAKNVLLMTHQRPDGDALGSTFGMMEFLRGNNIKADILLPGEMPRRYTTLCTGFLGRVFPSELDNYDLFLALDCANPERLGTGEEFSIEDLRKRCCCI